MIKKLGKPVAVTKFKKYLECPYRYTLDSHGPDNFDFLQHESAYIGIIRHGVLEKFYSVNMNEADIEALIEGVCMEILARINQASIFNYEDLGEYISDFSLLKLKLKTELVSLIEERDRRNISTSRELTIYSPDGILVGRPDLIFIGKGNSAIIDFKTGTIHQLNQNGSHKIKSEYREQLKLYAYLFYSKYDYFPDRLLICDSDGKYHNIDYTPEECIDLFNAVKSFSNTHQEMNGQMMVCVDDRKCRNCTNRDRCKFYMIDYKNLKNPVDVFGVLEEITIFKNGNFNLEFKDGNETLIVQRCKASTQVKIQPFLNKFCGLFNLKLISSSPFIFETTKRTTLKSYDYQ